MRYVGNVIRPPAEAESYILQVTFGCAHNKCAFCGTYKDMPFEMRPLGEVKEDILMASHFYGDVRRVFLADGNAFILPTERLLKIMGYLKESFFSLRRVAVYARASDILLKTADELKELKSNGLNVLYVGLETGSDKILSAINKGYTHEEAVVGCLRAQEAGLKLSTIILLGIGGKENSYEHSLESVRMINAINPRYLSVLTLMLLKNTPLYREHRKKIFELPDPLDLLKEMRLFVENLNLSGCIFRTNHASNYVSLEGVLNKDKEKILRNLDEAIEKNSLRPEFLRGF